YTPFIVRFYLHQNSDSSTYSEGEKVLAYHGPRIYEAKVQKAEIRKNEWRYFVHYLGWKKNWDEWVGESRLMKHIEANVMKQHALDKKKGVEKNVRSGRSTQGKAKSSTDAKVDKEDIGNNVSKGKNERMIQELRRAAGMLKSFLKFKSLHH
ncbi:hypothetical protein RYX36_014494, partial [Vicia faba]